MSARRAYKFYNEQYGDWTGPAPRKLAKMNEKEFQRLLNERKGEAFENELLEISELISNLEGEDLLGWIPPGTESHVNRPCDSWIGDSCSAGQGHDHELVVTNLWSCDEDIWPRDELTADSRQPTADSRQLGRR